MDASEELTNEVEENDKATPSTSRGSYKRSAQTSPVSVAQGTARDSSNKLRRVEVNGKS